MKLKYSHPAMTKQFDLDKVYDLEELKKELSLDRIKILFSPADGSKWESEKPKKKQFVEEETTGEN